MDQRNQKHKMSVPDMGQRLERQAVLLIVLALCSIWLLSRSMDLAEPSLQTAAPASDNSAAEGENNPPGTGAEGIIRFHIIAASDSEQDQALKLEVRNQVLARIQIQLADAFSREMERTGTSQLTDDVRVAITRDWISGHLSEIEAWAQAVLQQEGVSDSVRAELGFRQIPDRQYDGIFFPAGIYEALTLTIGEGAGQNWWCVIYPPLCLIDSSASLQEEMGEARFQAWLESLGGDRIVLKSKIVELLKFRIQ